MAIIYIESNTTGFGQMLLDASLHYDETCFLVRDRARYAFIDRLPPGVRVIDCDTQSVDALERVVGEIANVRYVVSTSDAFIENAARLSERLGLPGNPGATVALCRDKLRLQDVLRDHGVPYPYRCDRFRGGGAQSDLSGHREAEARHGQHRRAPRRTRAGFSGCVRWRAHLPALHSGNGVLGRIVQRCRRPSCACGHAQVRDQAAAFSRTRARPAGGPRCSHPCPHRRYGTSRTRCGRLCIRSRAHGTESSRRHDHRHRNQRAPCRRDDSPLDGACIRMVDRGSIRAQPSCAPQPVRRADARVA